MQLCTTLRPIGCPLRLSEAAAGDTRRAVSLLFCGCLGVFWGPLGGLVAPFFCKNADVPVWVWQLVSVRSIILPLKVFGAGASLVPLSPAFTSIFMRCNDTNSFCGLESVGASASVRVCQLGALPQVVLGHGRARIGTCPPNAKKWPWRCVLGRFRLRKCSPITFLNLRSVVRSWTLPLGQHFDPTHVFDIAAGGIFGFWERSIFAQRDAHAAK